MGTAAFEAAGPWPEVIGEQQCDTALSLVREDEQRFGIRPLHDRRPGRTAGVDNTKPFAPMRRLVLGALETACNRMALPEFGKLRPICLIRDIAARLGRQDGVERRAPDAG